MFFDRPVPNPTEDTEPYWKAVNDKRELHIPRCQACGHWYMPPMAICPKCNSNEIGLEQVSGEGTLYSFIVVHQSQHPYFFANPGYNVAMVQLKEGPILHSKLIGIEKDDAERGMPLVVDFEKIDDDHWLPVFKKAEA